MTTNGGAGTSLSAGAAWFRRNATAYFLGALVLAIATSPFTESLPDGELIEAVRLTIIMVVGLMAVGGGRRTLICGLLLVVPALVAKWVSHLHPTLVPDWLFLTPGILFLLLLLGQLLRFIARASRVNSEVLCAGVAGYLLLGMLWGFAYLLLARLNPDAFVFTAGPAASHFMKGFTAVYFSFITLCTVGYGDVVPVSGEARMLAMMEGITGTFYMAVLVARLVSLYGSNPPESKSQEAGEQ